MSNVLKTFTIHTFIYQHCTGKEKFQISASVLHFCKSTFSCQCPTKEANWHIRYFTSLPLMSWSTVFSVCVRVCLKVGSLVQTEGEKGKKKAQKKLTPLRVLNVRWHTGLVFKWQKKIKKNRKSLFTVRISLNLI